MSDEWKKVIQERLADARAVRLEHAKPAEELTPAQKLRKYESAKRRYERGRQMVDEAKKAGCIVCGEHELACLSFHHVDPTTKLFSVSQGLSMGLTRLRAEIAKCVVICENCHRKLHQGLISLP